MVLEVFDHDQMAVHHDQMVADLIPFQILANPLPSPSTPNFYVTFVDTAHSPVSVLQFRII